MSTVFTSDDIKTMILGEDSKDRSVGARRIWTDWKNYNESERVKLRLLGDNIFQLLKNNLSSRDTWHYMLALGTLDYVDAQETIMSLLNNSQDENIRGFAVESFSRYSKGLVMEKYIEKFWELIATDPSLVVRINSLRAISSDYLASMDNKMALKLFDLLDTQSHSTVRTAIIQILGDIGSIKVVPDLTHMMIARRIAADKKDAALALDRIAEINGYTNRVDLIKKITGDNKN